MKKTGFSLVELLILVGLIATILGLIANGILYGREKLIRDDEAKQKDPIVILEKRLQKQLDRKYALEVAQRTNSATIENFLTHNPLDIK